MELLVAFPLTRVLIVWTFLFYILSTASPIQNIDSPSERSVSESNEASQLSARAGIPDVPGVDELKQKVIEYGVATSKPDWFYTKYPLVTNVAQQWISQNAYADEPIGASNKDEWQYAMWGRIIDPIWATDKKDALKYGMDDAGFKPSRRDLYGDMFMKQLSQAFAEASQGEVFLLISDDAFPDDEWDTDGAWGGWEYPALTRNPQVDKIVRVSYQKPCVKRTLWTKGDGPSKQEPRGRRGPTKPKKHRLF